MKNINISQLIIGIAFLTLVFSSVGWSQSADIVLIIDSSSSMGGNDPTDLRKDAAELLIGLAASDTQSEVQIGIVDFDGWAVTLAPLTVVNPAGQVQLEDAVDQINSDGSTNIAGGLHQGFEVLSAGSDPDVRKAAVLLTDGEDNSYTDDIVSNYDAKAWSIYTIGLGSGVNQAKLQNIASATPEGEYYPVDLSKIHEVYNSILAKVTRRTIFASHAGYINQDQERTQNVLVDRDVRQLNFSANWIGSTIEMALVDPRGFEITPDIAATQGIGYQVAPTFVIYTVDNPMAGEWRMKIKGTDIPPEGEPYSLVVTGDSDFVTNFLAFEASYSVGDTVRIGIRIHEKTGDISHPVLGATTSAAVVRPDGRIETLTLFDDGLHDDSTAGDGVYANNYTNVDLLGSYLIRASVQNGFSRKIEKQIVVGNIDNVFVDGSTLTPAAGATLSQVPRRISAVISGPAGSIDRDTIVLRVDGAIVQHAYNAVNQLVSFEPAQLSRGTHTVSLSVNNTIETNWSFTTESGVVSRFAILMVLLDNELNMLAERNMLAVPLIPEVPYTGSPLSEMLAATLVIRFDTVKQAYTGYVAPGATDSFAVADGKTYRVNIPAPRMHAFTRTARTNPQVAAAPGLRTQAGTRIFVVSCDLRGIDADARYALTVKNLRTGAVAISGDAETPKAVWANVNRNSAVQIGDILEVVLRDAYGNIVAGPRLQTVSATDIHNAYLRVQLTGRDIQPKDTVLAQNYPNPFNPETWIPYQLSDPTDVSIQIYDNSGRLVRTLAVGLKAAGIYRTRSRAAYWDGKNESGECVASGTYFYTLRTPEFSATRRMIILK